MKTLTLTTLLLACFVLTSYSQYRTKRKQYKKENYVLTIKQGKYEKTGAQAYVIVQTTLTNNSADTLKYLSVTCSWREFYYVDNDKMSVEQVVCTKNFPIMLTLLPHKSVDKEIKLIIKQTPDTAKSKFKIGMNLYKLKNENRPNLIDIYDSKKTINKNIIWSNTIEM